MTARRSDWAVTHKLETVEAVLHLPGSPEWESGSLVLKGRSSTKRTALWTASLTLKANDLLGVSDELAGVFYMVYRDAPSTQDRAQFSLGGGLQGQLAL